MGWPEVREKIKAIDKHYSMDLNQHKILFDYAQKVPQGGLILELGVAHGRTAAMFILVAKERNCSYYGIDDFSLEGDYNEVIGNIRKIVNYPDWSIIESKTQDAEWGLPIDLLFIDAGHDETNVKPDCEKYIPFVKPGGVVLFDDWPRSFDPDKDPHWAVGYYGQIATTGWQEVESRRYMKGFKKPYVV